MRTTTRTVVALTAATALAVPTALLVTGAASADGAEREVRGALGAGTYELSAEHDDGRIEVSLDGDDLQPGSRWKVVIKHDGATIFTGLKRAVRDDDGRGGDWDVDRVRPNTVGADTFTMRITRVGGGAGAKDRVVLP